MESKSLHHSEHLSSLGHSGLPYCRTHSKASDRRHLLGAGLARPISLWTALGRRDTYVALPEWAGAMHHGKVHKASWERHVRPNYNCPAQSCDTSKDGTQDYSLYSYIRRGLGVQTAVPPLPT